MRTYILHGWTYSTEKWLPVMALLESQGVQAELLQVPGLTDGTDRVWTIDDYVEWLARLLKDDGKVNLVGHSNGGRISLAFTLKYPEKVGHLILVDSAGIYPRGIKISIKRGVFGAAAKVGKAFTKSAGLRSLLYKAAREGDYKNATPEMQKTMANLIKVDFRPKLAQVKASTGIIWGSEDRSTPLQDARIFHEGIRNSQLHIIPGANHSPHASHPEEVAKYIQAELARNL